MTEVNIGLLRLSVEQVLRCRCAFDPRQSHTRSNMKFRKRPVIIEAMQLVGTTAEFHAVYQWIEANTLGSFEPHGCHRRPRALPGVRRQHRPTRRPPHHLHAGGPALGRPRRLDYSRRKGRILPDQTQCF